MEISSGQTVPAAEATKNAARRVILKESAIAFEASFLAEMLKHTGLGKSRDSFGGGAGEDAFSSLLVFEQAKLLAERGGIGLAEHIFESLAKREGLG